MEEEHELDRLMHNLANSEDTTTKLTQLQKELAESMNK